MRFLRRRNLIVIAIVLPLGMMYAYTCRIVAYNATVDGDVKVNCSIKIPIRSVVLEEISGNPDPSQTSANDSKNEKIVLLPANGKVSTTSLTIQSNPPSVAGFSIDMDQSTTAVLTEDKWYSVAVGNHWLDEAVLYKDEKFTGSTGSFKIWGQWLHGF